MYLHSLCLFSILSVVSGRESPEVVVVTAEIESIRRVRSTATVNVFVTEEWSYNNSGNLSFGDDPNYVLITNRVITDNMWKPDIYFYQGYCVTKDDSYNALLWMRRDGFVKYGRKFQLEIPCTSKPGLLFYPFDLVVCKLQLISFGYELSRLRLEWHNNSKVDNDVLDDITVYKESETFSIQNETFTAGEFSTAVLLIAFSHNLRHIFIKALFPAALLVMLSWVGFWVQPTSTPARASISLTTVLTSLTLSKTSISNDRQISHSLTACDIYMWSCFMFIVLSTLEFAYSNYIYNNEQSSPRNKKYQSIRVDKFSRYCFPVIFILFNACYCVLIAYAKFKNDGKLTYYIDPYTIED